MDQVATDQPVADGALGGERAAVLAARERLGTDLDRLDSEVRAQVAGGVQTVVWKLGAAAAGFAAAAAMRKLVTYAWKTARRSEPPHDPVSPETPWGEALAWTLATAVGVGIGRLLAERGAAVGWRKATGNRPPGHDD